MKTKKEKKSEPVEKFSSEMDEARWAVVSFEGIIEKDLNYLQAAAKIKKLAAERIGGLCIVTSEAAEKSAL
jgi:hypothetical protein